MQQLTHLAVWPGMFTDDLPALLDEPAPAAAAAAVRPWMARLAAFMPSLQQLHIDGNSDNIPISLYKLAEALQGLAGLQELALTRVSVDQAWEQPVLSTALPGLTKLVLEVRAEKFRRQAAQGDELLAQFMAAGMLPLCQQGQGLPGQAGPAAAGGMPFALGQLGQAGPAGGLPAALGVLAGLPFGQGPDDDGELLEEEVAVARLEDMLADVAGGSDCQARSSLLFQRRVLGQDCL